MSRSSHPPVGPAAGSDQPGPKVLAIETSSRQGSVALGCGEELLASRPFDQTRPHRDHVVDLLPTLDPAMAALGWKPADIEEVHVSAGPGSFTGLRIAVTFARALAQAVGCRIVMVPTVEVLAANAPDDVLNLAVVLDAKRKQIFTAVFTRPAAGLPLEQIVPVGLMTPAEMLARAPRPLRLLGEGIDYHRAELQIGGDGDMGVSPMNHGRDARATDNARATGDVIELPRELWPPRAEVVFRLGRSLARAGRFTPLEEALPIYIRRPEAEEVWERKHGK